MSFDKRGLVMERRCNHCGHVDRFVPADETSQCGACGTEANPVSTWVCDRKHCGPRCAARDCFAVT